MLWEVRNWKVTRLCAKCTHLSNLQDGCWNHVSCCEIMYFQSNSRILTTFWCPKWYTFNKCVFVKWNGTIWYYFLTKFCEGTFWVWIGGFVHLYDGRNQNSPCTIVGIYIYLWCYQGLQHACINIGLVVQILRCFEKNYWKGHSYTDGGKIQQQ